MKNTFFLLAAALLFSVGAVRAQTTVDSINAKYQLLPMPEALTVEKAFPVLGSYTLTTADSTTNVMVTLDPESKGIVWVEGLPEGKFKAYLKRSPATYRVIAQKSESGKQIPEGTLIFDTTTKTLSVALGKKFDDTDPTSIFTMAGTDVTADANVSEVKVKSKTAKTKTKTKVVFYNAVKAEAVTTVSNPSGTPQQAPQDQ